MKRRFRIIKEREEVPPEKTNEEKINELLQSFFDMEFLTPKLESQIF